MDIPQGVTFTQENLMQLIGQQTVQLAGKDILIQRLTALAESLEAEIAELRVQLADAKPEACGEA